MKNTRFILIVTIFLLPYAAAHGSPITSCPSGVPLNEVAFVGSPSCTIGDKTFTFVLRDSRGLSFNPTFTAVAFSGNGGPAFILSNIPSPSVLPLQLQLLVDYTVSITSPISGGDVITGETVATLGASVVGSSGHVIAEQGLGLLGSTNPDCFAFSSVGAGIANLGVAAHTIFGPTCTLGTVVSGGLGIFLEGPNVSLTSAEFIINEGPRPTPEPSSIVLFATALVALLGLTRKLWII